MKIEIRNEPNFFMVASIFTLVFTVGLYILHFFKFPVDATILETHVREINLESTQIQVMLYMTLLGMFAMICAITLLFPSARIIPHVTHFDRAIIVVIIITAIVFGSCSKKQFFFGLSLTAVALAYIRKRWTTIDQDTWAKLVSGRRVQLADSIIFWLLISIIGCYFLFFVLLPLTTPFFIHNAKEFHIKDEHFAVTVLPGFDLCCSGVGKIKSAYYGAAMPLLAALSIKVSSIFGVPNTDLVRAVKLNQFIAAVMLCVLSYLINKKNYPYIIVLVLGLTAYALSNVGIAVGYPNQSGIRYIPALAGLIILVLELRREKLRIALLGSVAALAVILNPETGMAITIGYIVAAILKGYIPQVPIASTMRTLVRFMAIFIIVLIIGSDLILGMILKDSPGELFQFVILFTAGGYGGMVDKPSAIASLILLAALTIVLRGVWRTREGSLQSTDIFEVSIGSIILFWLMYYVNRMQELNLWFELVLLILMIAPRFSLSNCCLLFRQSARFGALSMIITCLIGGLVAFSAAQFIPLANERLGWQQVGCNAENNLDGKCLPWLKGSNLNIQMKALTTRYTQTNTLVLTGMSAYARLRGFNEKFPWYDPMEIVHKNDIGKLVNWINSYGPKYVIADDPASEIALASPEHSNQIQSIIPLLHSYHEVSRESEWVVFERINANSSAGDYVPSAHP